MGSFSLWHLIITLVPLAAIIFLIVVVVRSGRKATYVEKPLGTLAKWLTGLVALALSLMLTAWVLYIVELNILLAIKSNATEELLAAFYENAARLQTLGVTMIVPIIVAAVLGFCWIHRANANLWARKLENLSYSPGGAIGFYFVPILSLFLPYVAMQEICERSADGANDAKPVSRGLVLTWWIFFIASSAAKLVKNGLSRNVETIDGFLAANFAAQIELAIGLPLSAMFLVIIWRVTRLQARSASHSSSR